MITDVVFAVEIFDEDGTRLLGTTTDVLEQYIHAVAGDGEVVFDFEQVPLLDGTFHLTLTIHTHDGGTIYDQREYEDSFPVMNPTRTRGLVQLPHQDRAPLSLLTPPIRALASGIARGRPSSGGGRRRSRALRRKASITWRSVRGRSCRLRGRGG